jgi:hypothetical protein
MRTRKISQDNYVPSGKEVLIVECVMLGLAVILVILGLH